MDPKKLRELKAEVAALNAEATKILTAAAARTGAERALQEDEKKRLAAIKAEREPLETLIAEGETIIEASRAALSRALPADGARPAQPADQGTAAAQAPSAPPARRANPFGPEGHVAERTVVGRFRGAGDYFSALAMTAIAQRSGQGEPDPRIIEIQAADGRTSAEVPSDGSALVGLQYSNMLLSRMWEVGQVANRCTIQPVGDGFDGVDLPKVDEKSRAAGSRYGGITVRWLEDGVAPTATHPKVDPMELRLKELGGLVRVPSRLYRDATALGAYVMRAVPEELAYVVDDAIIGGNGKGKPLGLLDASCAATLVVSKESGQTADTFVAENAINMYAPFLPRNRANAAWYINQELLPQLLTMYLATGTSGQLVYMPPGGLVNSPYGTLFGYPVVPIEQCKKLGDKGDAILADMSEYLLIRKPGVQFLASVHVWFDTFDEGFRWKLELNGQPMLNSTITPANANSGFKLSPFVTLQARA